MFKRYLDIFTICLSKEENHLLVRKSVRSTVVILDLLSKAGDEIIDQDACFFEDFSLRRFLFSFAIFDGALWKIPMTCGIVQNKISSFATFRIFAVDNCAGRKLFNSTHVFASRSAHMFTRCEYKKIDNKNNRIEPDIFE